MAGTITPRSSVTPNEHPCTGEFLIVLALVEVPMNSRRVLTALIVVVIAVVGLAEIHGSDLVSALAKPENPGSLPRKGFSLEVPAAASFLNRAVIGLRCRPRLAFDQRNLGFHE